MAREEEKDRERKGIIVAVVVHALFLLLFFYVTWGQPSTEESGGTPGIDVNFGFDDAGSGDNNSMERATDAVAENTEAAENVEAIEASTPEDQLITSTNVTADNVVPDTKTTTTPVKPNTSQTTSQQTNTKPNTNTSQSGNEGHGTSDQKGNYGKETGTLDGKGLYDGTGGTGNGPGGSGSGSALSMDGWHLEAEPKVSNDDKETGTVSFLVKIDSKGEIVNITVKNKQVSQSLINKCIDEINKMEFVKNKTNANTSDFSTGTITFVFRLK